MRQRNISCGERKCWLAMDKGGVFFLREEETLSEWLNAAHRKENFTGATDFKFLK